jgi:hypothetical protein
MARLFFAAPMLPFGHPCDSAQPPFRKKSLTFHVVNTGLSF